MRMRIPLVVALAALFPFTACSDTTAPPEPAASLPEAGAIPTAKVVLNERFPGEPFSIPLAATCGEDFTIYPEIDHVVIRETETKSGRYKWAIHINSPGGGLAIGDNSGAMYKSNPSSWTNWYSIVDGTDHFKESNVSTIIAKGIDVDGMIWWKNRIMVNILDSGEVVVERLLLGGGCR